MQSSDFVAPDEIDEIIGIGVTSGLCHHQASAGKQRPEELPHRDVERVRRLLQHAICTR